MAITTYAELQTALSDWLNRADLDQQIPDFISLAESTLNDVLRSSYMVSSSTAAITSGRANLPTDALELVYVQVANAEDEPLEQITPQQLLMLRRARTRSAANPKFFAVVGREILVTPSPSGATSLDIDYYQKIPALSNSVTTNWLLTQAPHIYLYTSLLHATPFLMDDARYQVFQNSVSQQVMSAVKSSQTLSFDDIKSAGFSLNAPADRPAPQAINPVASTTVAG
jgi:hypothetical protein